MILAFAEASDTAFTGSLPARTSIDDATTIDMAEVGPIAS